MNDADSYIKAVADACRAAALYVVDWWSDDIDPRDGGIDLVIVPDADPEDYGKSRTLGWNEERGWFIGRPKDPHGELTGIYYIGGSALAAPADVAEDARKVIAGEFSAEELRRLIRPVQYREQEDEDSFEVELDAYRREGAEHA